MQRILLAMLTRSSYAKTGRNKGTLLTVSWEHHLRQCTTAGSKGDEFQG